MFNYTSIFNNRPNFFLYLSCHFKNFFHYFLFHCDLNALRSGELRAIEKFLNAKLFISFMCVKLRGAVSLYVNPTVFREM